MTGVLDKLIASTRRISFGTTEASPTPYRVQVSNCGQWFGFKNTLDLIIKYCEMAEGDPRYDLRTIGRGVLDGRACYVLKRRLPFTRPDDPYPNRLLVIYIDREWLVPTGCFAYADDGGNELLGSYVTTSVELNPGLTEADF